MVPRIITVGTATGDPTAAAQIGTAIATNDINQIRAVAGAINAVQAAAATEGGDVAAAQAAAAAAAAGAEAQLQAQQAAAAAAPAEQPAEQPATPAEQPAEQPAAPAEQPAEQPAAPAENPEAVVTETPAEGN